MTLDKTRSSSESRTSTASDMSGDNANTTNRSPTDHVERRRQLAHEYYKMEEKQAKLCRILFNNIYKRLEAENQAQKLCERDELNTIFNSIIVLEKMAELVHGQVAREICARVDLWHEKPYFSDILLKFYHFYKAYKAIIQRHHESVQTLTELIKSKPKFNTFLQKLLVIFAEFNEFFFLIIAFLKL